MTYSSEHRRMKPVLDLARALDIATNPDPKAIFEAGSGGFQIWCTPEDHPTGREGIQMDAWAFSKPCDFVASVSWGWEGPTITHLCLETDAYGLTRSQPSRPDAKRRERIHNRPADIAWAKQKIRWLFKHAGVNCPPIKVNG